MLNSLLPYVDFEPGDWDGLVAAKLMGKFMSGVINEV